MKELHKYQAAILKKFIFQKEMEYSEMKPSKRMENNKFQFHLDKLKELNFILKSGNKYKLTKDGKKFVARMDSIKAIVRPQMKIGVAIIATRENKNKTEYLVFTRLKQPFFGCQGLMAGKIELGEKIRDAARREFNEETGLNGEPTLVGVNHYLTRQKDETVDDLLLFFHWIKEPIGKLKGCDEGKYEWIAEDKLDKYIVKPFQNKEQFFKEVDLIKNQNGEVKVNESEWEDKDEENF